jgi:hypothetical protein
MTTLIKRNLKQHEDVIADGMKSFLYVGQSLMAIRDERLYADHYETFEAYCQKRWQFGKSRAYQLIEAAEVQSDLSTIVDTKNKNPKQKTAIPLPQNEAQARAVADAADTPEERRQVWEKVVETAPKNEAGEPIITAKFVSKVADEVVGPKNDAPKPAKPVEGVVEPVKTEPEPEFKPGFDPTEFDPEMNPELDRKSVAKLPRDQQVIEQPKMIEAFCRSVRKFVTDNMPVDPLLDETALNIADQQLTAYLSSLRQRKAYGLCPKCPDKINPKCGFCKGHGYVTKTTFESAGGVK